MLQELKKLVSEYQAAILYQPFGDEVNYHDRSFPLKIPANNLILPSNRDSDPFKWATKCLTKFQDTKPYILIPGTRFDIHGTRHGKGGGWYDRFLSKVPAGWLRIGIADQPQISEATLPRQKWDQSVDWVLVCDNSAWSVYKSIRN